MGCVVALVKVKALRGGGTWLLDERDERLLDGTFERYIEATTVPVKPAPVPPAKPPANDITPYVPPIRGKK